MNIDFMFFPLMTLQIIILSIIRGFVSNYMNFKVVRIKNFNLISI